MQTQASGTLVSLVARWTLSLLPVSALLSCLTFSALLLLLVLLGFIIIISAVAAARPASIRTLWSFASHLLPPLLLLAGHNLSQRRRRRLVVQTPPRSQLVPLARSSLLPLAAVPRFDFQRASSLYVGDFNSAIVDILNVWDVHREAGLSPIHHFFKRPTLINLPVSTGS